MKTILLACNAGMSTSLLVQKMQKEAVEAAGDKPVAVIARGDDGRMNATKILDDAMKLMGE